MKSVVVSKELWSAFLRRKLEIQIHRAAVKVSSCQPFFNTTPSLLHAPPFWSCTPRALHLRYPHLMKPCFQLKICWLDRAEYLIMKNTEYWGPECCRPAVGNVATAGECHDSQKLRPWNSEATVNIQPLNRYLPKTKIHLFHIYDLHRSLAVFIVKSNESIQSLRPGALPGMQQPMRWYDARG